MPVDFKTPKSRPDLSSAKIETIRIIPGEEIEQRPQLCYQL